MPDAPHVQGLLRDLVAFPILGGDPNLAIVDYLEDYLGGFGVSPTRVYDETGRKACLHARIGPPVDGGTILSGHTDVVPVEGQDWHTDPFALTARDGKLFGRGACDMKGYLACVLAAVPTFVNSDMTRPVYLAFSFDEEVGCVSGQLLAEAIRDHYDETPATCIVGEPSMLRPVVGHKGIAVYEVVVRGSAGHSSRIRTEVSAVHEAARLILHLESLMDAFAAEGPRDARFDPPYTSVHVGKIRGGTAHNIIADEARFTVDVRNLPGHDVQGILGAFRAFAKSQETRLRARYAGASISVAPYHPLVPALSTAEDSAAVRQIRALSGVEELATVAYASEGGQFSDAGFSTVICGPGDIAQAHRANEYVSVAQLEGCVRMLEGLRA